MMNNKIWHKSVQNALRSKVTVLIVKVWFCFTNFSTITADKTMIVTKLVILSLITEWN